MGCHAVPTILEWTDANASFYTPAELRLSIRAKSKDLPGTVHREPVNGLGPHLSLW